MLAFGAAEKRNKNKASPPCRSIRQEGLALFLFSAVFLFATSKNGVCLSADPAYR